MFASVADNQLLTKVWRSGMSTQNEVLFLLGVANAFVPFSLSLFETGSVGPVSGWTDKQQAAVQLSYIRGLVSRNSDFLKVVETPSAARAAIREGKLAIVLALEMDQLSVAEILELKAEYGVASVVPIHLADNAFGGTAVYNELFDSANRYLNSAGFDIVRDPTSSYQMGPTQQLAGQPLGAVAPAALFEDLEAYLLDAEDIYGECKAPHSIGMRNAKGLTGGGDLRTLLRAGMMVDVAHMSALAVDQAITVAESEGIPVFSSHTAMRSGEPLNAAEQQRSHHDISERSLTENQVRRIVGLGGVLGYGTSGDEVVRHPLASIDAGEVVMLTGNSYTAARTIEEGFAWDLVEGAVHPYETPLASLVVNVGTGYDPKEACSSFEIILETQSGLGQPIVQVSSGLLGENTRFDSFQRANLYVPLTQAIPLGSITKALVVFHPCNDDRWALRNVSVTFNTNTGGRGVLFQEWASLWHDDFLSSFGGYFQLLATSNSVWSTDLRRLDRCSSADGVCVPWRDVPVDRIRLEIDGDNLDLIRVNVETQNRCILRSGTTIKLSSGEVERVGDHYLLNIRPDVGTDFPSIAEIRSIALSVGGGTPDVRSIRAVALQPQDADDAPGFPLSSRKAHPFWARLTPLAPAVVYRAKGCDAPRLDTPAELIEVELTTAEQDAAGTSYPRLSVSHASGTVALELNRSQPFGSSLIPAEDRSPFIQIAGGRTTRSVLRLPAGTKVRDLLRFRIDGNLTGDNWNLRSVRLNVLEDPLATWNDNYRKVLEVTGGRGVALGTDLNGLQHQLSASSAPSRYVDAMNVYGPLGPSSTQLSLSQVGSKFFSLQEDGIAHIGMLPDFVQTLRGLSRGGDDSADRLFRSAEDTLRMWERVFAATSAPIEWAERGVTQFMEKGKKYRIGTTLPTWFDAIINLQVQEAAGTSWYNPALKIKYKRLSDGIEGDAMFTNVWQQASAAHLKRPEILEVWIESGPEWANIVYW